MLIKLSATAGWFFSQSQHWHMKMDFLHRLSHFLIMGGGWMSACKITNNNARRDKVRAQRFISCGHQKASASETLVILLSENQCEREMIARPSLSKMRRRPLILWLITRSHTDRPLLLSSAFIFSAPDVDHHDYCHRARVNDRRLHTERGRRTRSVMTKPEGHCHESASVTSNALERQMHLSQKITTTELFCWAPAMRLQKIFYITHTQIGEVGGATSSTPRSVTDERNYVTRLCNFRKVTSLIIWNCQGDALIFILCQSAKGVL